METDDNKHLSCRFLEELWNQKNLSIIDELLADTFVDHTPPLRPTSGPIGPEKLKQNFVELQLDFSDIHVSIKDQIAEEDKVVTQVTWECTLKSDDPSTASRVTVDGVSIDRFDSGKIVENWYMLAVLYRILNLRDIILFKVTPPACGGGCPPGSICVNGGCYPVKY